MSASPVSNSAFASGCHASSQRRHTGAFDGLGNPVLKNGLSLRPCERALTASISKKGEREDIAEFAQRAFSLGSELNTGAPRFTVVTAAAGNRRYPLDACNQKRYRRVNIHSLSSVSRRNVTVSYLQVILLRRQTMHQPVSTSGFCLHFYPGYTDVDRECRDYGRP